MILPILLDGNDTKVSFSKFALDTTPISLDYLLRRSPRQLRHDIYSRHY